MQHFSVLEEAKQLIFCLGSGSLAGFCQGFVTTTTEGAPTHTNYAGRVYKGYPEKLQGLTVKVSGSHVGRKSLCLI